MKNLKLGFSLAEILIAVGIISVIATMGFSITARNIDKAYDLYIYNGYKSLTDAIADANFRGFKLKTDQDTTPISATTLNVDNDFLMHLEDLFDGELVIDGNQIRLNTPNRVNFIFNRTNSLVLNNAESPRQTTLYEITMQVPIKRQKNNNGNIITSEDYLFYYVPEWHDIVFPAQTNTLSRRIDLLPTYIDDGVAGHVINGVYQQIRYNNFYDSICQTLDDLSFSENHIVTRECPDIPLINGVIRIVNPRKVF